MLQDILHGSGERRDLVTLYCVLVEVIMIIVGHYSLHPKLLFILIFIGAKKQIVIWYRGSTSYPIFPLVHDSASTHSCRRRAWAWRRLSARSRRRFQASRSQAVGRSGPRGLTCIIILALLLWGFNVEENYEKELRGTDRSVTLQNSLNYAMEYPA